MKERLMNPLADNVFQMTNAELIGLAKNRFLDYETQDKIALNPYKRAHMYLIENTGLCSTARDILWNKPGYVNKFDLVSMGHYKDSRRSITSFTITMQTRHLQGMVAIVFIVHSLVAMVTAWAMVHCLVRQVLQLLFLIVFMTASKMKVHEAGAMTITTGVWPEPWLDIPTLQLKLL